LSIPAIEEISPENGFNQWPISKSIEILIDQEVDLESAKKAIFLYGPEGGAILGAGMDNILGNGWNPTEEISNGIKTSINLDLEISIQKVDSSKEEITPNKTYDESELEYSLIRVRPCNPLIELTDYKLYISGDEEESSMCLTSRSVFDAKINAGNTGSGEIQSAGVYHGLQADTIVVEFTRSGDENEAIYEWYLLSSPTSSSTQRSFRGRQELLPGTYIETFGSFEAGDVYTIDLKPAEQLEETIVIEFSTGGNYIQDLPDNLSESPIGIGPSIRSYEDFIMTASSPANGEVCISDKENTVVLEFSKEVDPNSVTYKSISLSLSEITGRSSSMPPYSFIVSGNKIYINIMEH